MTSGAKIHYSILTTQKTVKNLAKKILLYFHKVFLKIGFVVLPNHYYISVADIHELGKTKAVWAKPSEMIGVNIDLVEQLRRLTELVAPFQNEYKSNMAYKEGLERGFGPGFGYIEAQCLHGMIRSLKPRRLIEIGSGVSTYCALRAAAMNAEEGHHMHISCIEPFPSVFLRDNNEIELITKKAQDVDISFFEKLGSDDIIFIDSTHAVKPGGDVAFIYLEIIPRLKKGTVIHIHDIFFPYAYQRDVMRSLFQWSETAFLQALLVNNSGIGIIFSLSMLHYKAQTSLKRVFPEYLPATSSEDGLAGADDAGHFPSSIYLRVL